MWFYFRYETAKRKAGSEKKYLKQKIHSTNAAKKRNPNGNAFSFLYAIYFLGQLSVDLKDDWIWYKINIVSFKHKMCVCQHNAMSKWYKLTAVQFMSWVCFAIDICITWRETSKSVKLETERERAMSYVPMLRDVFLAISHLSCITADEQKRKPKTISSHLIDRVNKSFPYILKQKQFFRTNPSTCADGIRFWSEIGNLSKNQFSFDVQWIFERERYKVKD